MTSLETALLTACKQALAALQSESQLDRANAIGALRKAIAGSPDDPLRDALRPFVDAYVSDEDPISDSDLDDEQPRGVYVTLGDCRRARRALERATP